jgi:hypothetical protein
MNPTANKLICLFATLLSLVPFMAISHAKQPHSPLGMAIYLKANITWIIFTAG